MRAVIQRVNSASVTVGGELTGIIGRGLVVLVGAEGADEDEDIEWLAGKTVGLRLFPDDSGAMAQSVAEIGGEILIVSQFTLFASTKKGTRPSWHRAAKADLAMKLYEVFVQRVSDLLGRPVQTGRFGAMMQLVLVNDGPVTLIVDTKHRE
jgi:D-aminoacyl-tRNA deacylase